MLATRSSRIHGSHHSSSSSGNLPITMMAMVVVVGKWRGRRSLVSMARRSLPTMARCSLPTMGIMVATWHSSELQLLLQLLDANLLRSSSRHGPTFWQNLRSRQNGPMVRTGRLASPAATEDTVTTRRSCAGSYGLNIAPPRFKPKNFGRLRQT